ncbi:TfuA domain-containing protein [Phyllobacterium brassicacearum]|uniref:TfuA domain-containing protein n=1 Tax=Phyllobacterium brassicacearum TaxID=314235 RepID=A0A2P7BNU6_9HYPH|nr:TfuA-like protein [Phyllobacterium brassicacearum]PSH68137.1 TfuA domain-containing protein [Phyllobacterium brassicacearum]TDQ29634.1 hypothetical protein DEV91_109142 [Phyllobacterium brassicacearum]
MARPNYENPILVFLGPTLRLADAQSVLDAVYLQPAAQGDILLAAHAFRPRAMVLIDGQFEDRPPVRHKEIQWAMAQGIVMIGAASMGALRAAEMCALGMVGVGLIYRWYRRWLLAPDDAVAVHSAPAELGFLPLTDSLIDLQRTFSSLMRHSVISPAERNKLSAIAREINFRDRTLVAVLRAADWGPGRYSEVQQGLIAQKRADAVLALKLAPLISVNTNHKELHEWISTNTFDRDLTASGIDKSLLYNYKFNV